MKRYFFSKDNIDNLSYPPKKKWIWTGLWNKNSMRYEWFWWFRKSHTRLGYEAYRFTDSDYFMTFKNL